METISKVGAATTGQGVVTSFRFSTTDTDSPFDAWRSLLAILFDCTPAKTSLLSTFRSNLVVQHFGTFLLCRSFADGGRLRRSETRLAWDDLDHIVVSCLLSGGIALGSPVRRLRSGDVAVIDLSSPARFAMAAADAMHVIVPRTALPTGVTSVAPVPCRIFARNTAIGIFLRGIIESLSQASHYFDAVEVTALGAYFPELLGWCLGPAPVASSAVAKGNLGKRLRRHIEENLNRTDLTSARLAREIGVSRSQLYRQFEASGGVETYIRSRRLRRCLQALADPRRADLRIGKIAYDMGFADEAHFSRLFRQTFGQSPRDIRAATRQGDGQVVGSLSFPPGGEPSFADWLLTLGTG